MQEFEYKELAHKILGAAFEVHKFLGNGFPEIIYQKAMTWEIARLS